METKVLLASSVDGSLSLLKVGSERHFDDGITRIPDHVWPSTKVDVESDETPPYVSRTAAATLHIPSRISSTRLCEKQSFSTNNDDSKFQCSLYPSVITYLDKFLNIMKTLISEIFIFSVIWIAYSSVVYGAWNLNLPNGCAI
ncbi:hypothetical protein ES288_A07G213700v1 [Gossypium darwinii]|uniref:Uncharacterized protein n=2 Tax=Gossypium TaxID=3633 RepID=A0A5D2PXY3_GOSTO|nr:hypothetical protein ES288_A07G213700v1 [Gossypium darwinii]TYI20095.1 hypothetical protein ES332_A07G211600v1 [Gossypium tomentosum]